MQRLRAESPAASSDAVVEAADAQHRRDRLRSPRPPRAAAVTAHGGTVPMGPVRRRRI